MLSAAKHLSADPDQTLRCAQGDNTGSSKADNTGCSKADNTGEQNLKQYYVYIMTNRSQTLYTGVTNNLQRRIYEHKHHLVPGFTSKYHITRLVYFEETSDVNAAIAREKQIKGWLRARKKALIESMNPAWRDLSEEWQGA